MIACPKCGTSEGIYRSCDARWDPELNEWVRAEDMESTVECTQCDHTGDIAEFEGES